jgi:hypothetical protein
MDLLLAQTRAAMSAGLYLPALMLAVTIPDVCAALSSEDGKTTGPKYQEWLVTHANYSLDGARGLYQFRCRLLHEGSVNRGKPRAPRIAFVEPAPRRPQVHDLATQVGEDLVQWLSIPVVVEDLVTRAEAWHQKFGQTNRVQRNKARCVQVYPDGLPGHVSGLPVVM